LLHLTSRLAGRFAQAVFMHVNLGASAFKGDFIHRELHELDAPAVFRLQPLARQRIRNRSKVKSVSLVLNGQPDSLSSFAPAANLN
jgi:hypothetical protein